MVIKPGQTGSRCVIPRNTEKLIDRLLKNGDRTLCTDGMKQNTIENIIKIYSEAGWKVEFILDQRDGNYLQFEE